MEQTGTGDGTPAAETPVGPPLTGPDAPGSPAAVGLGCRCSVLANAAFRTGAAERPLVDPACAMHREAGELAPARTP